MAYSAMVESAVITCHLNWRDPQTKISMPKLVRDNIPQIIEADEGREPKIRIAEDDQDYFERLREKLVEEVGEFLKEPNAEEMADILEVLDAFAEFLEIDPEVVLDIKENKVVEKGRFAKRIILE